MKKDRNCDSAYPIYPNYQTMGMGMPNMIPGPIPIGVNPPMGYNSPVMMNSNPYQTGGTIEQQLSSLNSQVNSLEKRINSLESLVGNKYNSSNFQVM
ncbi:MAG: dynactin subunit 2 [Clostridium sp.]|nr:dynactin subunit 2 [Clostridium sp.]MCM1444246.1 dynactin subunit 2 [Candidatus Amulumruptor caecigallinarius]